MTSSLFYLLNNFASTEAGEHAGPHISLKAEEIFKIGDFSYTNSMLYSLVIGLFIIVLINYIAKRIAKQPQKGLVAIFEMIVDYVIGMLEGIFGSRKKAVHYAPVFAVYFIFIMISNLSGLMPWVGEGFKINGVYGLRPFTADLNSVIAMSIFSIFMVQVLSIRANGFKGHVQHYFGKGFNLINWFIGILESFGELIRITSLSLRLFLNTVIGEILISVFIYMSGNFRSFALIPIILFEIMVAYIQAYIFTALSATYLGLSVAHAHDHEESQPTQETQSSATANANAVE
jgi:F-type H+-transporting ATPase subunit a